MDLDRKENLHDCTSRSSATGFGRVTICVLCYGAHTNLAERFLTSLYRCTDPGAFALRAGLNEVAPATTSVFHEYARQFGNIEIFSSKRNVFKSPMMRRMFFERPIETEWVIWFDDDSYLSRADWLQRLAVKIQAEPDTAQWGKGYVLWKHEATIESFIKDSSWYRGLSLVRGEDPDGSAANEFHFCTGGFWAIKSEVIRSLDWPDPRLIQAHDDFLLGEALRQNGYSRGQFESGVQINDYPRRNAHADEITRLSGPPSAGLLPEP